jgi:predicted O-methyltransferase YrrM
MARNIFKRIMPCRKPPPAGPTATGDPAFVDWCYRKVLRRESDEQGRRQYLQALANGMPRLALVEELMNSAEYENRFAACQLFPPGHPLSPLPSGADIEAHAAFDWHPPAIPGVELGVDEQRCLLQRLARHYPRLPFSAHAVVGSRYYYENSSYSYADAIFLGCMMLEFKPRRIIEVGCGFSSAAMLDISERFFDGRIDCLFIDPDPSRLRSLLEQKEVAARLMEKKLQDVPLNVFSGLEAGDILFIDSSHISKVGSDVNLIFFDVLPRLQKGVLVHIHDVFYPLEYPQAWLQRGWVWNEQYLLHAFLQFNHAFAVRLFSHFLIARDRDWFSLHMADCLKNPGGCLWLEKTM